MKIASVSWRCKQSALAFCSACRESSRLAYAEMVIGLQRKHRVNAYKDQILSKCLGNNEAIERIAVYPVGLPQLNEQVVDYLSKNDIIALLRKGYQRGFVFLLT
jgi:hypothetical protein